MSEAISAPNAPLRGFQRRHLRREAHALRPIVHVGAAGLADPVLAALEKVYKADHLVAELTGGGDSP